MRSPLDLLRGRSRENDREPLVVPVENGAADVTLVLAAGLGSARRALREPARRAAAESVLAASELLARDLARSLLDADGAPSDGELRDAAGAHRAFLVERLGAGVFRAFPSSVRDARPALLEPAAFVLRNAALDYHTSEMVLGYHGRQPVFVSMPVTQAQAHVWLMGAVYDRLERWVAASGAPALEREAARWWFSRWRPAQPARGDEFARVVREQEFSLVDRPLVTLGGNTVLEHMLQAGLLDDLPPKQRTVAEGLAESAAGVWEVVSRAGDRAVFRDPVEGDEFSIAEHGEAEYGPGSIVLGRIVPFAGDTDLRSPGAAIVPASSARPGMALGFAEAVAKSGVDVPPPVAIEGMVQMVFGARGLPREVPLPVSPDQATVILRDLNVALRATGVAKEVDPAEAPERFRNAPDALVVGYEVDIVLADYLREMFPLSQKSRLYRQMTARRAHDERARKDPRGR